MGSTYTNEFLNGRPPQPVDLGWFAYIQFDADDSAPDYIGLHTDKSASDDDTNWKIYKFTYSGDNVTTIKLTYGSWTNRAGLF
jgi:hypothetical protein